MVNEKNISIYDYSVGICGILLMFVLTFVYGFKDASLYLFLFLVASEIIIDKFMIHIRRISISLSTVVDISGFITMGLAPVLWMRSISIFIVDYYINKKPLRVVFLNIGMFILSITAGGFAYNIIIKLSGVSITKFFSFKMMLPVVAFIIADLIINYICICVHVNFMNPNLLLTTLPEGLLWDILAGFASIPMSLEFSDIYLFTNQHRLWFSILFMLPIIFTCFIVHLVGRIVFTNRQLKALSKVALAINSFLDLDKIYNVVFDTISSIVGFRGCYLFEYDSESKSMTPISYRIEDEKDNGINGLDLHSDMFDRAAQSSEAFILNNLPKSVKGLNQGEIDDPLYKSCILVPMRRMNRCVGCIGIFSDEYRAFNENILEFLMVLADQAAIAIENAKLFKISKEQAITDNLTYLYNQRYFYKYLNRKVEEYSESAGKMSLIMFDIDHFKKVNDLYGHIIGDYVLKEVAVIIKGCVRKNDIVARYGGEEFTVVLPDIGTDETYIIAERVRERVESHIFAIEGIEIRVTVSGGICEYPEVASSVTELVNYADRAMYVGAKFNGRNKIKIYNEVTA